MKKIPGRSQECLVLQQILDSPSAEFVALYGRRRIGKTHLINTFFTDTNALFFTAVGSKRGTLAEQLRRFTERIGEVFLHGITPTLPKDWHEAFKTLSDIIQKVPHQKIILFLDELPWLASKNSRLLSTLEYYWNQYWSLDKRIKLIVCGSAASWIIKKIINNRGGFHNRVTKRIHLKPFNLHQCKEFLNSQKIYLSNQQIIKIFMATGGVAFYLKEIQKGWSATEAIEQIAFSENSLLLQEFEKLFSSLFDDAEIYIELLRVIAKHHYGLTQTEIANATKKIKTGGTLTNKLQELKDTGFLMSYSPYEFQKKGVVYRLIDEYTLFYFRWIEPIKNSLQEFSLSKGYWYGMEQTVEYKIWSGLAFESVCFKHIPQIRKKLGIQPTAKSQSWRYTPQKRSSEEGAQIDLLFDRLDDAITICEIKYANTEYLIDKSMAKNLLTKQRIFQQVTRSKKQLFLAMITSNGLKENTYADELVSGVVVLDDLFVE